MGINISNALSIIYYNYNIQYKSNTKYEPAKLDEVEDLPKPNVAGKSYKILKYK